MKFHFYLKKKDDYGFNKYKNMMLNMMLIEICTKIKNSLKKIKLLLKLQKIYIYYLK